MTVVRHVILTLGHGRPLKLRVLRRAMSLLWETSLGGIVIDLEVEACPKTCENVLKLRRVYYYNLNDIFNGSFHPASSFMSPNLWLHSLKRLYRPSWRPNCNRYRWRIHLVLHIIIASQNEGGDVPRYFTPEIVPHLKHMEKGTVSMAVAPTVEGQHAGGCASQFFITLADGIEHLDETRGIRACSG